MTIQEFLSRLDGVRQRGARFSARCPAHPDKTPSLSVSEGEQGILVKCWAGCSVDSITSALGLRVADLFTDAPFQTGQRAPAKVPRVDRRTLAFQFELCALDLRLRAEQVFKAARSFDVTNIDDSSLDRLMRAVASGYQDLERAKLMEHVTDTLRWKVFQERTSSHAA